MIECIVCAFVMWVQFPDAPPLPFDTTGSSDVHLQYFQAPISAKKCALNVQYWHEKALAEGIHPETLYAECLPWDEQLEPSEKKHGKKAK